jgi:hypothetical protein
MACGGSGTIVCGAGIMSAAILGELARRVKETGHAHGTLAFNSQLGTKSTLCAEEYPTVEENRCRSGLRACIAVWKTKADI